MRLPKFILFFSTAALLSTGCGNSLKFQYDASVPSQQQDLLNNQLAVLDEVNITQASLQEAQIIGTSDLSSSGLKRWLSDRVKVIVGENYDSSGSSGYRQGERVAADDLIIVMLNLGADLYLRSVERGHAYSVSVASSTLSVTSPRVGIVQIGEGLFNTQLRGRSNPQSRVAALINLSVLFHEARHSDGNGSHVAFPHAECPSGDYRGDYACDQYINGPYAVQATMLRNLYPYCTSCTAEDRQAMLASMSDYYSRLLPYRTYADPAPVGGGF